MIRVGADIVAFAQCHHHLAKGDFVAVQ